MYCPGCRAANWDDARLCKACGRALRSTVRLGSRIAIGLGVVGGAGSLIAFSLTGNADLVVLPACGAVFLLAIGGVLSLPPDVRAGLSTFTRGTINWKSSADRDVDFDRGLNSWHDSSSGGGTSEIHFKDR